MSYAERLEESGELGRQADEHLRSFAKRHRLNLEESNASLKVRADDRRAVVLQPSPGAGVASAGLRVQSHGVSTNEMARLEQALGRVGGEPKQMFSFIPLDVLVERWPDVEASVLDLFFGESTDPSTQGRRVRLAREVQYFPAAVVPVGAEGVVVEDSSDLVAVRLDQPVPGLEGWGNQLRWEDRGDALADLEVLNEPGQDSQGRRFFTSYWTNDPWNGGAGLPVGHAASNEFVNRRVKVGDVIYIVHYEGRELYLGARLNVGTLLSKREAEEHFGHEVWDASDHVLAEDGTEELLVPDRLVPRDVLRQLLFIRASDDGLVGLKFDADGAANQQTLRAVRELSPESAETFDRLIQST